MRWIIAPTTTAAMARVTNDPDAGPVAGSSVTGLSVGGTATVVVGALVVVVVGATVVEVTAVA